MYIYLDTILYVVTGHLKVLMEKHMRVFVFYVLSSVSFIQRKDMSIDDLENLCIQIQFKNLSNSKPFFVATWYRPPNSNVDKFNYFENFIDMLDAENVEYYLLGDIKSFAPVFLMLV